MIYVRVNCLLGLCSGKHIRRETLLIYFWLSLSLSLSLSSRQKEKQDRGEVLCSTILGCFKACLWATHCCADEAIVWDLDRQILLSCRCRQPLTVPFQERFVLMVQYARACVPGQNVRLFSLLDLRASRQGAVPYLIPVWLCSISWGGGGVYS